MAVCKGFRFQQISGHFRNASKLFFSSAFIFLSGCTTTLKGDLSSAINSVISSAGTPTALTLNAPVSSPGALASPIIQVSGVSAGDTVKVFSDACVTSVGSAISAGATANVTVAPLAAGTYTFYANTTNSSGSTSACTAVSLSYTYQVVPVITLTRDTFNFSAAGTTVGQAITLTRDAPGLTNAVTLTSDSITAGSTQVTLGTQTVTFSPGDTTVTVLPASFTPVTAANPQGDNFFRIKISAPTGGAALGTTTEAIVNLLDDQLTENYFFEKPLYSALESDGNASILIGRSGSTVAAASVQVTFIDGTAVAGTDYTNAPITVNFAAGAAEATALIPIINRAAYQANRSFFIELNSPSAGTTNRAWATAKIRILDVNDPTVCDNTNNNVGVNAGFGGGAGTSGNPYLICSITQLFKVRNNLTKFFRVTADLDLDPSIDADSATGGLQPLSPVTGTLTGGFNGDEHILKNFRYSASYTTNPLALFDSIGGNVSILITGINLIQSTITNTNASGHTGGIIGQTNGSIETLSNNMFSGYVGTTGGNVGGLIMESDDTIASPMIHNFTHGLAVGGDSGGIYAGLYDWTVEGDLDHCYSTMNVQGTGATGGLVGAIQFISQTSANISNSHSKGIIIGTSTNDPVGGVLGVFGGGGNQTMTIQNTFSTSKVYSPYYAGGLIGFYYCPVNSTCGISNSYATGSVSNANSGYIGGLIGYLTYDGSNGSSFTISNVYATGDVTASLSTQVGGLLGRFEGKTTNGTFSLTGSYSSGNVSGQNSAGGLIGSLYISGGSGTTHIFNHNYTAGNVTTSQANSGVGGLIGAFIDDSGDGIDTTTIENSYASGNVSGPSYVGGVIGAYSGDSTVGSTVNLTNLYSTGTITATGSYVAGLVGLLTTSTANSAINLTISGCHSTGNVSTAGDFVGGGVGYFWADGTNGYMNVDTSYATGNISGRNNVGGFIGEATPQSPNASSMTFTKIYATGSVTASGNQAGGLFGQIDCESNFVQPIIIQKSYATGNVSGHNSVGGLIGQADENFNSCAITLQNNYASGTATASGIQAGGFIGEGSGTAGTPLVMTNNYTRSTSITGTGSVGGLIGASTHVTLTAGTDFWLKDAGINAAIANDGNQQTAAALQTPGTYPGGWDFTTIWFPASAGVYPLLQ